MIFVSNFSTPSGMSTKLFNAAAKFHSSFENLFTGGSEYRKMMHSEASAAILKLAFQCTDLSKIVANHIKYPWSDIISKNAASLRDDMLTEYIGTLNQWKKEMAMERNKYTRYVHFPRMTPAILPYFKKLIGDELSLMESFKQYQRLDTRASTEIARECCIIIAMQAARLVSTLVGMVDRVGSDAVIKLLSDPIVSYMKQVTVCKANNKQKFEIINQLQARNVPDSSAVTRLSSETLYVISHIKNQDDYRGFAFVDSSVHTTANEKKNASITYIEIMPSYRNMSLGKELIQWIKTTARDNGFSSLCTESLNPHVSFWTKCGFKIHEKDNIATWDTNPMLIENIVN